MNAPATTKRDLVEHGLGALDKAAAGAVSVSAIAGGVSFASALEVMEFAKLMCVSDKAVPSHLRGNAGMCLAVTFQSIEWRMSPFAVANKSYVVNDRIAYESQLIHAVIEARAPLQRRLECDYVGEGPERQCKVTGYFTNGDDREYLSPKIKDIRVKNSPLWKDDPDQQLWYYSSRSWARKWCPDVLMGIYSREELMEHPELGREDGGAGDSAGLSARLAGSERSNEGHHPDHASRELATIAPAGGGIVIDEAAATTDAPAETKPKKGGKKKSEAKAAPKTDPKPAAGPTEKQVDKIADRAEQGRPAAPATPKLPKNPKEYQDYALAWIKESTSTKDLNQRWKDEMALRNNVGVTLEEREKVELALIARRETLMNEGN